MIRMILGAVLALALAGAAVAQDDDDDRPASRFALGGDGYVAGQTAVLEGAGTPGDVFMAGERVYLRSTVGGAAHLAGRRVRVEDRVEGNVYAAGFEVSIEAPVGANATVMGYDVELSGPVAGNLRAMGSELSIRGDIGGAALLTGETISLDAAITGDAVIVGRRTEYGTGARVDGTLTIYAEDPEDVSVPEAVAPAGRVSVRPLPEFEGMDEDFYRPMPSSRQILGGFLMAVVVVGLTAVIVIAIAPKTVQAWRELALARTWRALGSGFLVTSALSGSAIVLSFTLIGILLVPAVFVVTWLALYFGYVLGAYVLGAAVWRAFGKGVPEGLGGKFAVAAIGALLGGLAWFVPVIGWLFTVALTLIGVGVLFAWIVPGDPLLHRPRPA